MVINLILKMFSIKYICIFLIALILFFVINTYIYHKNLKNKILNILKMNSKNYLKDFVWMANKKDFKIPNMIDLAKIKFEKIYGDLGSLYKDNIIFKNVLEDIDVGILILDDENKIYYMNKELVSLFNIGNSEKLIGTFVIYSPFNWIFDFKSNDFEINGENISCCFDELENGFKFYKFKNVSEYKKLDYMSKEFISNITHELKTPLTSIIGFSETLKGVEEEEDRQMFYSIINKEAIRLNNLISDVLIFSEIETQNDMNKQKIEILSLLNSIKQLLSPQTSENNFEIKIMENKIVILSCEKYLRQVFINIMDNSIKHSFGTCLEIKCIEELNDVILTFSDDGIGIPEDEIENIFGRFYKVIDSKTKSRGTGLGLSIVESSIQKLGASIEVFNNLDKGVTFKIIIPKTK